MTENPTRRQSDQSVAANTQYFLQHLKEYEEAVGSIDSYRTIHAHVSDRVAGVDHLIDIGNGGVFAYDTSGVKAITAIDLFLDSLPPDIIERYFPKNARLKQGSALALPEPDNSCDMVLMVMLLHHLSGQNWRESWANAKAAMAEGMRVLRPGGRMLIVESCVPQWFFQFEKPAFRLLSSMTKTVLSHPVTIQFPAAMIADELERYGGAAQVRRIPKGKFILQFGVKVPSFITPAQPYAIETTKVAGRTAL
jgi:ubiquinone/menaquinone biosynthesis C-methylase UbiE